MDAHPTPRPRVLRDPRAHTHSDLSVAPVQFRFPDGSAAQLRLATCSCGKPWLLDLSARQRAVVRGMGGPGSPYERGGQIVANSRMLGDENFAAVKAEALSFVADHPEAARAEVLAHLEDAGFGSSRYPVQRWRKEAAAEAAAEAEAAAQEVQPEQEQPVTKKSGGKLASLSDEELAVKLLATSTLADRTWAPERGVPERNPGEKRDAYIRRVLLGEEPETDAGDAE